MSVFFIAEAGVNHNGDPQRALDMVVAAQAAGADAVKFQSFNTDKVMGRNVPKAAYQERNTGDGDQYDMVKPLEMSADLHRALVAKCDEVGIEFMSTPFDEDSADLLVELGMRRMKVASGELTNHPFLEYLTAKNLPMIVSTGMATMEEVEEAVAIIAAERAARGFAAPMTDMVTILHCTSNYPADAADVNLRAMGSIARVTGLAVGYSDHTLGATVATAAVALGATVIEKHFTLDRALPGPDHRASIEPAELAQLIAGLRDVEAALGNGQKVPAEAELSTRDVARRSIVAARDLPLAHVVGATDVAYMRPGTGIAPRDRARVIGRAIARPVAAGALMAWDDLV